MYQNGMWSGRFGSSWNLTCRSCVMKSFRWNNSANVSWYNCDTSVTRKHSSCSPTLTHRSLRFFSYFPPYNEQKVRVYGWLSFLTITKYRCCCSCCLWLSLQLSSVKSQLEEQKIRLEKAHGDEMEQLLQKVKHNFMFLHITLLYLLLICICIIYKCIMLTLLI